MGKGRGKRLTLLCGLPEDVLGGEARVTWFGRKSVMVEGQRGMVELGESRMRLKTKDGVMTVQGEALVLRELSSDAAMIEGKRIDTVTYVRIADG